MEVLIVEIQAGDTKLVRFLAKNEKVQEIILYLLTWKTWKIRKFGLSTVNCIVFKLCKDFETKISSVLLSAELL